MTPIEWALTWFRRRRNQTTAAYRALAYGALTLRAQAGEPWTYVADMWRDTGCNAGRLYLALAGLEVDGLVASRWVEGTEPRRRAYAVAEVASP